MGSIPTTSANKTMNKQQLKEWQTKYRREWTRRRRSQALYLKGSKCVRCGTKERLEFDHIDPSKKSFTIEFGKYSWPDIKKELDKCQLLCHDCHVKKTKEDRPIPDHGTFAKIKQGCYCDICSSFFNKYRRERYKSVRPSSNGRTLDSDSSDVGSNPARRANASLV